MQYRSSQCVFLGYSAFHKGYKCLHSFGRVYLARHIVFNEKEFPYSFLFPAKPEKSSSSSTSDRSHGWSISLPYYSKSNISTGQTLNSSCSSLKNNVPTSAILPSLSSYDLNQDPPTTVPKSTMPPTLPLHDLFPHDSDYSTPLLAATVPNFLPFTHHGPKKTPYTTQKDNALPANILPDNNPLANTSMSHLPMILMKPLSSIHLFLLIL